MSHYLRLLLRCAFSLAGWCVMAYGIIYGCTHLGSSMRYAADAGIEQARLEAQAAREQFKAEEQRSITAYMELESKRTTIEQVNKKALLAEYRLQAVCKKAKIRGC